MTTERDDGGPAFPSEWKEWDHDDMEWKLQYLHRGMSVRDYFAAKALHGVLASGRTTLNFESRPTKVDDIADAAYLMADAMLRAREKQR
jgi:hypothetical protein